MAVREHDSDEISLLSSDDSALTTEGDGFRASRIPSGGLY